MDERRVKSREGEEERKKEKKWSRDQDFSGGITSQTQERKKKTAKKHFPSFLDSCSFFSSFFFI